MVRDFTLLGLHKPTDLINKNPLTLYTKMSKISGVRKDPCVLDTYIAVIDFMNANQVLDNLIADECKTIDGITFTIKRYVKDNFIW